MSSIFFLQHKYFLFYCIGFGIIKKHFFITFFFDFFKINNKACHEWAFY